MEMLKLIHAADLPIIYNSRKYVYDPIENGVILEELDRRNPKTDRGFRKIRFHQFLNESKGIQILRSQIWQVVALLRISSNKRKFESNFKRLTSKQTWLFDPDEDQLTNSTSY